MWLASVLSFIAAFYAGFALDCNERVTEYGRVCVCNATYCDPVPDHDRGVKPGEFRIITTSRAKLGFGGRAGTVRNSSPSTASSAQVVIKIDHNGAHQTMLGFGGAFTDSTGMNIDSLPPRARENLLQSYFGKNGIAYNLCRVPVGGTDMSTRSYSYDDTAGDTELAHFALQTEDLKYKIPYINRAIELTDNKLNLFATAWTAPPWMKTNRGWAGVGFLKPEYYQVWANYYVKFFEAYAQHNITFWAMTTQNEPVDGYLPSFLSPLNAMGWTPRTMNEWISRHLGPTLRRSPFARTKIIVHDDSRVSLPLLPQILNNKETLQFIDGVGVHWYENFLPASLLDNARSSKENWFILGTEACNGALSSIGLEKAVTLGSWDRADKYINDIIENLEHGYAGWVDWNMVMNQQGGPTYIKNYLDAPIIVNNQTGEFYKQPMFYALGHFSKYILPGSVRIDAKIAKKSGDVRARAFKRPDGMTVVTVHNRESCKKSVQVQTEIGVLDFEVDPQSLNTILYK